MNKPLLIVGLMLGLGAAVIGGVVVLGSNAPKDIHLSTEGLKVPAKFPVQDLKDSGATTTVERPEVSENGPWPKLAYDETNFPFGRMAIKAENSHAFVIRNEGDADLVMKTGKATCKCTTFSVEKDVLKPGEETKLVINWHGGPSPDRSFSHGGPLYTNDPGNKEVNFTVKGAIEMPVEMLPELWSMGNVSLDKAGTLKAAIASKLHDQFEVESIESESKYVSATVHPMTVEEKAKDNYVSGYRLELVLAADAPPGKLEEAIKINIKGIDGIPFIVPDKLLLQLGQFEASVGRDVKLLLIVDEKDMTEPLQITNIEASPPFLKAELEELGKSASTVHRYAVHISVPPGRPHTQKTETKSGHLKITTNHPSKEVIDLEVLMNSH
jgi:hypothetical protein